MGDQIIDCCSLLNLYAGWGGLDELRMLNHTWYICEAVQNETEFTREYDQDGIPQFTAINIHKLSNYGLLLPAKPETEAEIEDYVNFASEIDDGEAQALALAKHRGFILLTDDRKAMKMASQSNIAVRTTTTAQIIQSWAFANSIQDNKVRAILSRIEALARFKPHKNSPDFDWWKSFT